MLYEIISPDKFLRPYLKDYATLSAIYIVVRKAYTKRVQPDREFLRKTNAIVQEHIDTDKIDPVTDLVEINNDTIELIQKMQGGENTKVINLVKSIEKLAEDASNDPYLIGMAERAKAVQENFESRQTSTTDALQELLRTVKDNEERKKKQTQKGMDGLTYFVYSTLKDEGISEPQVVSQKIKSALLLIQTGLEASERCGKCARE